MAAHRALRRAVHVALAVLPVGHRRPRFQRLMGCRGLDAGLVEDEIGFGERRLDVAVLPLLADFTHRQLAGLGRREDLLRPLDGRDLAAHEGVAVEPGVRAAWPQARHRINGEGERLVIDLDLLDSQRRRRLVDRGHGQDRLAFIERFGRVERALHDAFTLRRRQIVFGENALDTFHRQRFACIDARDARVRHRAQQELGEHHPLRAEVLGVFRLAGHLRDDVGSLVILANIFVVRHFVPSAALAWRHPGNARPQLSERRNGLS